MSFVDIFVQISHQKKNAEMLAVNMGNVGMFDNTFLLCYVR
jgi:hypothetical protein